MNILNEIIKIVFFIITIPFPINKKTVILLSYYGKGYGDNPKAIAEEIHRENDKIKLVWCIKEISMKDSLPSYVLPCMIGSLKYYYYMNTAHIRIDNSRSYFRIKKKKQIYIQTWHGFALKQIEKDVENSLSKQYISFAKRDSKMIDLIVSDSDHMTKIYKESFWYNGNVVKWGAPRNDIIINKPEQLKIEKKVKSYYNIPSDYNIVLYAPTFRKDKNLNCYNIRYDEILEALNTRFNGKFVFLIRLHPIITSLADAINFDFSTIFNASDYPDMQELLAASAVIISDYSSVMFDFSLSLKPCFQYAVDIDEYKKDRNFYIQLDELPFDLATDNDELKECIMAFDLESYVIRLKAFMDKYGIVRDGQAAHRCVQYIIERIG